MCFGQETHSQINLAKLSLRNFLDNELHMIQISQQWVGGN